jgi:hypothetical protein
MTTPPKPTVLNDVTTPFKGAPNPTREERLEWLKAELQKGLDSGVSKRSLQDIYDDVISRHNAA